MTEPTGTRLDPQDVRTNTFLTTRRRDKAIELSDKLLDDPERAKRLESQRCVVCYYTSGRIGGRAITARPCASCGIVQSFSSTATDKLCKPCGKALNLCVQCGADIDLRMRTEPTETKRD